MWSLITACAALTRTRIQALREDPEAGYSTETVVVTALLAALAITVLGILTVKVIDKVNSISL